MSGCRCCCCCRYCSLHHVIVRIDSNKMLFCIFLLLTHGNRNKIYVCVCVEDITIHAMCDFVLLIHCVVWCNWERMKLNARAPVPLTRWKKNACSCWYTDDSSVIFSCFLYSWGATPPTDFTAYHQRFLAVKTKVRSSTSISDVVYQT